MEEIKQYKYFNDGTIYEKGSINESYQYHGLFQRFYPVGCRLGLLKYKQSNLNGLIINFIYGNKFNRFYPSNSNSYVLDYPLKFVGSKTKIRLAYKGHRFFEYIGYEISGVFKRYDKDDIVKMIQLKKGARHGFCIVFDGVEYIN